MSEAPVVAGLRGTYSSLHWTGRHRLMAVESSGGCSSYFGPMTPSCSLDVVEMDLDGANRVVIIDGPLDVDRDGNLDYPFTAAPSPDRRYVAVALTHFDGGPTNMDLWVLDRSDGSWRALTEASPLDRPTDDGDAPIETGEAIDWQPHCTIYGTRTADLLRGTPGADLICGLGGDDVIRGLGGDDVLFGHGGNDRVIGGAGRDIVVGNAGRDRCDSDREDLSRVC